MNKHWNEAMAQAEPPDPTGHDASAARPSDDRNTAGELHFRELVNILRRRSRLILATALCGTMVAFALGLSIPPKYTAKAEITIDTGDSPTAAPTRDETVIDTHVNMLFSHDHLQHVLDDLQGKVDLGAASPAAQQIDVESAASRPRLRNVAPSWLPGPSELAQRLKIWIGRSGSSEHATSLNFDHLERHLSVRREGRSRIIGVSYTSTAPDTAAIVANRVAELYLAAGLERKRTDDMAELTRLGSRIAELKISIEQSSAEIQTLRRQRSDATRPPSELRDAEQRLQQIEREAVAKGQLYHTLLRRHQEILDHRETITPDARILSLAATPDRPSSPNPLLFILPALILFLICGSMLSVLLERLDRGLRSERDINEALGVRCVGLVPRIAETERTCPLQQYVVATPLSVYAEALRSIAAAMQLASPWRQPKVILITSSLPGEGKSTLAVSLSTCVALLRRRVLLIDFDFKQASILRDIEGNAQRGVIDLLLNNASPAEAILPVPSLGIDYLPMNRCSVYPLMRFAAVEMPRLLHQLRDSYDCVMIKAPPVLGRCETRLLATMADEILFVVKWGSTRREFVQNALNLLRDDAALAMAPQLPSVSALITQVDLREHARYRYGDVGEYLSLHEKYATGSREEGTATTSGRSYAAFLKRKIVDLLASGDHEADSAARALRAGIARLAASFSKAARGNWTS